MIINGPNLNLLGQREPDVSGHDTLEGINRGLAALAADWDIRLDFYQSNHEGDLVDAVQRVGLEYDVAV